MDVALASTISCHKQREGGAVENICSPTAAFRTIAGNCSGEVWVYFAYPASMTGSGAYNVNGIDLCATDRLQGISLT
jgi:hypothetical protein